MWVFLNDSFLSIVAHRTKPDKLLVRARIKGDIEAAFPGAKVKVTPDADYRYRAEVLRSEVARVLVERVESIRYDNFKATVRDEHRHAAYLRVWSAMADAAQ